MPVGLVIEVDLLTEEAFPQAIELLADRLTAHGLEGQLTPVMTDGSRLDDVLHPVPRIVVGLSVRGAFAPAAVERLPLRGWRDDEISMRLVFEHAMAWCDLPQCRYLAGVGAAQMVVDPGDRAWLAEFAHARGFPLSMTAETPTGAVRRVMYHPGGHVTYSMTLDPTGDSKASHAAALRVLRELAPAVDYGLVARLSMSGGVWEDLLNPSWVPEQDRVFLRDCRDLERTLLPGVFGAQLVNGATLEGLPESPEWRRLPTAGSAEIVINRSLAQWLSPEGPGEREYEEARELFSPVVMSQDDIAAAAAESWGR